MEYKMEVQKWVQTIDPLTFGPGLLITLRVPLLPLEAIPEDERYRMIGKAFCDAMKGPA